MRLYFNSDKNKNGPIGAVFIFIASATVEISLPS